MPATDSATKWVENLFQSSIVPTLVDYIKIPNKSVMFDPEWRAHGFMDKATEMFASWARSQLPQGATLDIVRLGERTPVIFIDIPGAGGRAGDTVMLYGHLDKQPRKNGWVRRPGALAPRIGQLSLVICLDSGCANYDQLWSTTSLRGLVLGTLDVSLLTEGVHSGDGTGVIAASERVVRQLLDRLED